MQISSENIKLLDDSSKKILKDFLNQYEKTSIIKKEHLEKMPPYQGGGDMILEVRFSGTTFNKLPFKFENFVVSSNVNY